MQWFNASKNQWSLIREYWSIIVNKITWIKKLTLLKQWKLTYLKNLAIIIIKQLARLSW